MDREKARSKRNRGEGKEGGCEEKERDKSNREKGRKREEKEHE